MQAQGKFKGGPGMSLYFRYLSFVSLSLWAATAAAQIEAVVDPFETGQGYVSQKLIVETDSDWTIGNLLVELASGTIFYENNLPSGVMPPFRTDLGMVGDDTTHRIGGADLGMPRESPVVTDPQRLDITYCNTRRDDIGRFPVARISLSTDSQGRFWFTAMNAAGEKARLVGTIRNGVMEVDE